MQHINSIIQQYLHLGFTLSFLIKSLPPPKKTKENHFTKNLNFKKYMFEKYFHLKLTQESASNIQRIN